jgi:hypothetical protein
MHVLLKLGQVLEVLGIGTVIQAHGLILKAIHINIAFPMSY